jgi:hypothetical protein
MLEMEISTSRKSISGFREHESVTYIWSPGAALSEIDKFREFI